MKKINTISSRTKILIRKLVSSLFITGFLFPALMAADRGDGLSVEEWMFVPFSEDIVTTQSTLETWMTVPFETALGETAINLESWMTVPFEVELYEVPVVLESWMSVPFDQDATEFSADF